MSDVMPSDAQQASEPERTTLLICYALHGAAIITGLTAIVGVIINHIKVDETTNAFVRSHHRWLIRTFWFGLLWTVVCGILTFVFIGLVGFAILWVWWVYRIVRGILAFTEHRAMPVPG